ncbi:protein FAR1-RELATED SEQUENCE 5-like [Papaver somniferum]|uniref:protein FAR1-RELATED SEQUENCE 5-like n=1 Tax=Papaver somniferum TaxID=3469 RepID=UPI000E6FAE0C|nr:protein FAR1-RELATED SEQUENCE 5-like [Papaver somniferum]
MDEPPNTFTCGDDQVQSDETEAMNHSSNGKNDVSNLESPYEGMHFNTREEAQEYYTEYGRRNGFSVRVRSTNKTRVGVDEVTSVYMVCAREGKKKKEENIEGIDKKGRSCSTIKFFYAVQVDEEGRAVNFFWVDARSRMSYEQFGEVVFCDTTYRANKYEMPFAPFTGVNHHYQTIQFGCALLQDETKVTFSWLFSIWLEAMGGKHPSAIITDQDDAMAFAVKKSKFKKDVKKCLHHTYKIKDFEEKWNIMIEVFGLSNNDWLKTLYEIRESWVPVYHRGTFYAGMNTTGRNEGVNAFFNEFVSSKTNLKEFVIRYDQALKKIVDREIEEDYVSEHTKRIIDERNLILKHATEIYTRNMFGKFREQLLESIRFKSEEIDRGDEFNTYLVKYKVGGFQEFIVKVKPDTYEGYCECQYFEFKGLPCKNVLKVLGKLEVDEIPPHFILKRWLKGANSFRGVDETDKSDGYDCSVAYRLSYLC